MRNSLENGVEALGEPAVDRSEEIACLLPFALIAPKPRHAHRRARFPGLCLLRTRNGERTFEIGFRIRSAICLIKVAPEVPMSRSIAPSPRTIKSRKRKFAREKRRPEIAAIPLTSRSRQS
jgi:hypothetical protein